MSDGEAPSVGTLQRQPELAQTLEAVAREGPDAFYRGPIARDMVTYLRDLGGLHAEGDFERAKGEYVTPITTEFRGRKIYECPPNGQGVIVLMILKILSRFEVRPDPLDIDNLHIEIEATRLAYAARDAFLSDPAKAEVPVSYLLSDHLADDLAAKIDLSHAISACPLSPSATRGYSLHRGRRRGAQRGKLYQFAIRRLRQRTCEPEFGRSLP